MILKEYICIEYADGHTHCFQGSYEEAWKYVEKYQNTETPVVKISGETFNEIIN